MWLRERLLHLFPALEKMPPDAYVVGGAVRDLLIGRPPADVDVASNDPLACARLLGRKVIRLGSGEHLSAWRVVAGEHVYDFAEVLDHDIDRDLARRDFTFNAMAVELALGHLLDPHGGRSDLGAKRVRMVRAENFDDDPLRMLKAVRMAIVLGFAIDEETVAAIQARAGQILDVAAERVTCELSVIFSAGQFRRAVALLHETRLDVPLFGRSLASFDVDDLSLAAAFAMLVHDPRTYAERWRWSDALLHDVLSLQRLVDHHDRIALFDAGERLARELPALLRAHGRSATLDLPDFAVRPLLSGHEIAAIAGIEPGPELGRLKRGLIEAQLRGEVRTAEEAERFVSTAPRPPARDAGDRPP